MEKRILWFFVVALLAVDILLLVQRRESRARFRDLQRASAIAMLKTGYAAEEEALLTGTPAVPPAFPRAATAREEDDAVQFVLLASVDNCTNCIEDEVTKLNELMAGGSRRVSGIQGFFVDEERSRMAKTFIEHLSPAPVFPMSVRNALSQLPGATTPLVLVIRSRDGKILDAHKPIPEDLTKRDAFYARWAAALGMS